MLSIYVQIKKIIYVLFVNIIYKNDIIYFFEVMIFRELDFFNERIYKT